MRSHFWLLATDCSRKSQGGLLCNCVVAQNMGCQLEVSSGLNRSRQAGSPHSTPVKDKGLRNPIFSFLVISVGYSREARQAFGPLVFPMGSKGSALGFIRTTGQGDKNLRCDVSSRLTRVPPH